MKRLIKKAEGQVTYIARSPIEISHTGYETDEFDRYNLSYSSSSEFQKLLFAVQQSMVELGPRGLAEYIDDDLKDVIESIIIDVDENGAATKIMAKRELTPDEIEKLKDNLAGQYADGWGEDFEQFPISTYKHNYQFDSEDEDEDGNFVNNVETATEIAEICAHFWNPNNFSIDIQKV